MFLAEAFGSWLIGQLADAARTRLRLGERVLGSEYDRVLRAASDAAIARTARELRDGGSDEDWEHLAAVLDQVFQARVPAAPLEEHATILQALQAGMTAQLAVLGDPSLTASGQSSAQVLGLSIEQITETLTRTLVQEVVMRGAGGGPLTPLADQLNHDLTHLQGHHTSSMLHRIVAEFAKLGQQRAPTRPIPRELPRLPADFTGRGDELARLRGLLAPDSSGANDAAAQAGGLGRPVITAIDGMAGIGKSALALQAAHDLVETGCFRDGQLYLNLQGATPGLAPLEPLDALGRLLRSLDLDPTAIPTEVEEAAARFRSIAADRRLLVLLDNARSAEQVRPLLPASASCAVLITSRQVLATLEGVHPLHLDLLPKQQALELLARIAGPQRVAAESEAAGQVVRLCGRLPLAIRIAGARLAARPTWQVRTLAERLGDATCRLEELDAGELAVRASFDVSLHALQESPDPTDQAVVVPFGLLSLPDGPDLSLAAVARLLDQPEPTIQRLLERLVDAQLLETPRAGRYQFHDLVRLYAREHASIQHPEPARQAALTRTFAFYTATAWHTLALLRPSAWRIATADPRWTDGGLQFPDAPTALAWLEAERVNLLAAISQAAAMSSIPAGLAGELTRALLGFFHVRSHWHDGVQANQTVLELARQTQDRAAQAHAHTDLGILYRMSGRYAAAIACQDESLSIFRELGDRRGQASSLGSLGVVYKQLGRYAEAVACQQESLTISRELGDRRLQAVSLGNLGLAYERVGRYAEAIACQQENLGIRWELGDRHGRARCLGNLGLVYERVGRYAEAVACQQESLGISRELGDRRGQASSLGSLGVVYKQLGRYAEAVACQQESLTISRELGDRHGQAEALRDLGDLLRALGRHQQGQAAWRDALVICEALQIPEADELRARLATLSSELPEPTTDR